MVMIKIKNDKIIPKLKKGLFHPMDDRTSDDSKYLKNLNPIIDIDKPFRYTWNGKERVFLSPPSRPNDRAILVPIDMDWIDEK